MTESKIQRQLISVFGNYDYPLCNAYVFGWESDFFAISKSGYTVEVEIKISKADFKKDFTKTDKHKLLAAHKQDSVLWWKYPFTERPRYGQTEYIYKLNGTESSDVEFRCPADLIPNKFYYACPNGLLDVKDIPPYAGLFYVTEGNLKEIKRAPFLHKNVKDHTKALLQKYYWKCINHRRDVYFLMSQLRYAPQAEHEKILTRFSQKYGL